MHTAPKDLLVKDEAQRRYWTFYEAINYHLSGQTDNMNLLISNFSKRQESTHKEAVSLKAVSWKGGNSVVSKQWYLQLWNNIKQEVSGSGGEVRKTEIKPSGVRRTFAWRHYTVFRKNRT